jgi:phosphoglycolate phosphatase-like HAD superfamily hydrolase
MEMKYSEEMVGKKGSKELKKSYSFNSTNSNIDKKMTEISRKFKTVVDALNYLSSMGWELVSVTDEKYYFKNVKGKPPVRK